MYSLSNVGSSPLSIRGVLESNTLLSGLSEEQMQSLAEVCRFSKCAKSELIWGHGEHVNFFGLVAIGFVKMVRPNSSDTELTLEIIGPGQMFGVLGALEGSGCPLMAYGLTDTAYLKIPKDRLLAIYEESHLLKDRLLRKTALRMHQKLDFMAKLSSGRAEERIAAILFILAESYGEVDGRMLRLNLPLTRQQIGEMAGTTTETTIRVLSKWSQERLVDTERHLITILDPEGLERKLR